MSPIRSSRLPEISFIVLLALSGVVSLLQGQTAGANRVGRTSSERSRVLHMDSVVLNIPVGPDQALTPVTLKQLMQIFKVPGISLAVISNYRIVWARGYGSTDPAAGARVTPGTLFQAASISKPVTAIGALWLVEQGMVSLDEDVNNKLKSWKVPENEFTANSKVTLRRIMSHSAGLTVHGFAGYPIGEPLPTLVQILNGEPPANSPAIRVDIVPGTKCRYSGGGTIVERQLMMDVSGKSFEQFMEQQVFRKMGMADSTFEQHLPQSMASRAATGTRADGTPVNGRWHIYPELAPDGLWTTSSDLAKLAIEVSLSKHGRSNRILSQKMTREMLTTQISGGDGPVGLGFGVGYQSSPDLFRHNGGNEGFQSHLMMFADTGQGFAALGNSDAFSSVEPYLRETIAKLYGWKYTAPPHSAADAVIVVEALMGLKPALDLARHINAGVMPNYKQDAGTLNALGYRLLREKRPSEAIEVFKRNTEQYPADGNVYDSLGEAYLANGQKQLAIANYQKSLQLNANNQNAARQLKVLEAQH
ncbi:MAG: serine hydrolase [Bryobacteraceae bacterium]|nr:serine hydrolase [Bryobacteraceae bacterium]